MIYSFGENEMDTGFYIGMSVAIIFFIVGWAISNVGLGSKKTNKDKRL